MRDADSGWQKKRRDPWAAPLDWRDPAAAWPSQDTLWTVKWALIVVGLVGGSALARHWWGQEEANEVVSSPAWQAVGAPKAVEPSVVQAAPAAQPVVRAQGEVAPEQLPSATPEVSKCVVNGRVTYGEVDCRNGTQMTVSIRPGPSMDEQRAAQSHAQTMMEQASEIDRAAAWESWRRGQSVTNAAPTNLARTSECAALDRVIEAYDAQARQPQPPSTQDWIKEQRAAARSRQFALHC